MAVFGNNNQTNVKAITETPTKEAIQIKLNDGSSGGVIKTVNVNLGSLSVSGYDSQKVMNIIEYLAPCLSKTVYSVSHVRTSDLTD